MSTKSIGTTDADRHDPSSATLSRRSVLLAAAGSTAVGLVGAGLPPDLAAAHATPRAAHRPPLWRVAAERGLTYGSAMSTRLFEDAAYRRLVNREAAILFTEDDLLWYQLKPTPDSPLDFSYGDRLVAWAKGNGQLVLAAHLVWDEGLGEGWPEDYLWNLDEAAARKLLFGTERALVDRYRGRVAGWIVANEVTDPEGEHGIRADVPWYQTIGPGYIAEAFRIARRHDPHATLVLNEFGFETTNSYGDDPVARQRATLQVLDTLLADNVPVDALGIQAHLLAENFAGRFDRRQYRRFLSRVADRGLKIVITELDVLDDGLPANPRVRDQAVGDIYARYLDTALAEPAVKSVITFGLSDRYTWLEEDYPRDDGSPRRPLPYDADLRPKPAYRALRHELATARHRRPLWRAPRQRHR